MAPFDSATIGINNTIKTSVMNDFATMELLMIPVNTRTRKLKNIIQKIEKTTYFTVKRLFDIVCSLFGILALVPVAMVTKVCYIMTGDRESIFYKQRRIGKDGNEFDFYKLRSMIPNATEVLEKILKEDEELAKEYMINKKLQNDPRITKVGKILRTTSLDELPQFLNVLKGDMSVIGNRPYLPDEKDDMGLYFDDIEKTKCGIVSLWAVEGRSNLSFEERLKIEQYYSHNQSLWMDLKIFLKVFKVVLLKEGAK